MGRLPVRGASSMGGSQETCGQDSGVGVGAGPGYVRPPRDFACCSDMTGIAWWVELRDVRVCLVP